MKTVQINTVCGQGSTGKICVGISESLSNDGIENYILYGVGKSKYPNSIKYAEINSNFQALKSRIFGNYGFQSKSATKRLLKKLDAIKPSIVHLHNLHGHNVNLDILFKYLKEKNIKVIWTFHDCWAFTGYCPYYDMVVCKQWKEDGCKKCPQKRRYTWFFDRSRYLFEKKKELFTNIDLFVVTPSEWLANQVKESFLKDCKIKVINNGVNLLVFYPTESDFRKINSISENKFVILGVAEWVIRKGLDVFINLADRLDKEKFQIVLVGTNDEIDKQLPDNIISIHRTNNQQELAEIYSAADLFVNPTREENYPTVNMEAIACGTPVLTFRTGGSPEIPDEKTGMVVECDDVEALYNAIITIEKERPFTKEDCIKRAENFCEKDKYKEYVELYKSVKNHK